MVGRGKKKELPLLSPVSSRFIFVFGFLNSAGPTISERGTGYNYLKGSDKVFILYRLTPEDIKEGVTIPLKFVMFQNVASLMVSKVKS